MKTRANEIDLLRFVAALSVMLFHYAFLAATPYAPLAPLAKYGYLGVELFFMISGFVILMTAASADLQQFVASRIARLYPAYWVCCSLTFAVMMFGAHPLTLGEYAANMTMLNGAAGIKNVDGSYWSLLVEIRFYILVGLLLLARQIERIESYLWGWLAVSTMLAMFPIPGLSALLIATHAPYFIAGGVLFLVWSSDMNASRAACLAGSFALCVWLAIADGRRLSVLHHADFSGAVIAGIVCLFFVVLLLVSLRKTGRLASMNFVAVGALTYPLYLLHQNIGLWLLSLGYPVLDQNVVLWGTVVAIISASWLVHILVERPYARGLRNAVLSAFRPKRITA